MNADQGNPMRELAEHLASVAELIEQPAVKAQIGQLAMEFQYALVSFRTRFPELQSTPPDART